MNLHFLSCLPLPSAARKGPAFRTSLEQSSLSRLQLYGGGIRAAPSLPLPSSNRNCQPPLRATYGTERPLHQLAETCRSYASQLVISLALSSSILLGQPGAALASDGQSAGEVGKCLFANCPGALAQCVTDKTCLQDLICLQGCSGSEDETACQVSCNQRYENKAVAAFQACAVTQEGCVAQKADENLYPAPPISALVSDFDTTKYKGKWYITAGQNELFDQFDCQVHYFDAPKPGVLDVKLNWRISTGDDFLERSDTQNFKQVKDTKGLLLNHDNVKPLHYEDDWHILAAKPDKYIFVYYKGNNDAWKGYGGSTIYTRESVMPEEYKDEMRAAAKKVNLDFDKDFKLTDNTCKPHPADTDKATRAEGNADDVSARDLEDMLEPFGNGRVILKKGLAKQLSASK